jgi:hypothetical protein
MQRLFLWCGVCDAAWLAPEDVGRRSAPSVDVSELIKDVTSCRDADEATVRRYGWDRYPMYRLGKTLFGGTDPSEE